MKRFLIIAALLLAACGQGKQIAVGTSPDGTQSITLYSGDCDMPEAETAKKTGFDPKIAVYQNTEDKVKKEGCYIIVKDYVFFIWKNDAVNIDHLPKSAFLD